MKESTMLRTANYLLISAVLVLVFGGLWSIGEAVKETTIRQEIKYLEGSLEYQKMKDPQDKESKGLFLYIQKLELERE